MLRALTLVFGLLAGAAQAQDDTYDPLILSACWDAHLPAQAERCIGMAALRCASGPQGGSTVAQAYCYGSELAQWDGMLNDTYQKLMAQEKAAEAEGDWDHLPDAYPRPTGALRQMQRAWISYRDEACLYEYAQWAGGTGGGPAELSCKLESTARQVILLETYLRRYQD